MLPKPFAYTMIGLNIYENNILLTTTDNNNTNLNTWEAQKQLWIGNTEILRTCVTRQNVTTRKI